MKNIYFGIIVQELVLFNGNGIVVYEIRRHIDMWDEWEWFLWDEEDYDWDYGLFPDEIEDELDGEVPF